MRTTQLEASCLTQTIAGNLRVGDLIETPDGNGIVRNIKIVKRTIPSREINVAILACDMMSTDGAWGVATQEFNLFADDKVTLHRELTNREKWMSWWRSLFLKKEEPLLKIPTRASSLDNSLTNHAPLT